MCGVRQAYSKASSVSAFHLMGNERNKIRPRPRRRNKRCDTGDNRSERKIKLSLYINDLTLQLYNIAGRLSSRNPRTEAHTRLGGFWGFW
jgi:hypothetical protein